MNEVIIQERVTMVCGEPVLLYSGDSVRWCSDRNEAEKAGRRHLEFVESMKKSLMKSSTFMKREFQPRQPNKLQRAATELRKQVCGLVSAGLTFEQVAAKLWPDEYSQAEDRIKLVRRAYVYHRDGVRRGEFSTAAEPASSGEPDSAANPTEENNPCHTLTF